MNRLPYSPRRELHSARSTLRDIRAPGNFWLRWGHTGPATTGRQNRGPLGRDAALALVEAALFSADEPLNSRRLASIAALKDAGEARRLVRRLQSLYNQDGTAFQIEEIAGGYQLLSRQEFHPWLARLRQSSGDIRLSNAAKETLAIVAYRQPIMRADIEGIRGVQCGEILRLLMEKGLIRIAGRHPSLGRPVLYGTTRKFLQFFGLNNLDDLPLAEQLKAPAEPRTQTSSTQLEGTPERGASAP